MNLNDRSTRWDFSNCFRFDGFIIQFLESVVSDEAVGRLRVLVFCVCVDSVEPFFLSFSVAVVIRLHHGI